MTCRRLVIAALAISALAPAASAQADAVLNPSADFAVGSQPFQTAQALAKAHWGVDPCGGQVTVTWVPLAPNINATSTWTNPKSSYDNPDLNGDCRIEFNTGMDFDWPKFCTVMIHEMGHLSGKPHSPDPHDVMAAFYEDPAPECAAPAQPAAPAQAPVAASKTPARAAVVKLRPTTRRAAAKRVSTRQEGKPHKRHKKHRAKRR